MSAATASRSLRCLKPLRLYFLARRDRFIAKSFSMSAMRLETKVSGATEPPLEAYLRSVREYWGENLPEDALKPDEYEAYVRLYGEPIRILKPEDLVEMEAEQIEAAEREAAEQEAAEREAAKGGSTVSLEDMHGNPVKHEAQASGRRKRKSEKEGELDELLRRDNIRPALEAAGVRVIDSTPKELEGQANGEDECSLPGEGKYMVRMHPLTRLGIFVTRPSTILVPKAVTSSTVDLLSEVNKQHLDDAAHRFLGGARLLHSPVMTMASAKVHKDSLDTLRYMSDMGANVYLAAVLPGFYSEALSALTELRRRLGGDWVLGGADGKEPGVEQMLDVGGGGAAALAWQNIVQAEEELRLDGALGPAARPKPQVGTFQSRATVVVGSDALRYRMSKMLENTTFIPRIPESPAVKGWYSWKPRKLYNLIVATNTISSISEPYKRKDLVQNLWSLLNPKGGVLLFIEKGNSTGFEAIAGARSLILNHHINAPSPSATPTASIVAPCTHHSECPMCPSGLPSRHHRRDYCRFRQRYQRPRYLQHILKTTTRDHDDIEYSYVAIRRGIDVRSNLPPEAPKPEDFDLNVFPPRSRFSADELRAHAHTLPRTVFQPIKRQGHVIIDVCTPEGRIERWTVPKSYSKAAYRDARKSAWGDLWALGAKTKVSRSLDIGEKEGRNPYRKKIRRVVDMSEGSIDVRVIEMDKKGGKKMNPGKREKERREGKKRLQQSRGRLDQGLALGKLD